MKVGIDGVLLGAWCEVKNIECALDVGTGSGLIALMVAQRSNAEIDAIDIDENALVQSKLNFSDSPWAQRLNAIRKPLQEFSQVCEKKYDLIVSNPPYFIDSLKAPDLQRSVARHADSLSHSELLENAIPLLNKTGRICLILPVNEGIKCTEIANKLGLNCDKQVMVYPKPEAASKRLLLQFSFSKLETMKSGITIETENRHVYTDEFSELLKDFYLKL